MSIYPWQDAQWQKLSSALLKDRMPHALLLHGAAYSGKLNFAKALGSKILCENKAVNTACGQCKSCKLLKSGSHPDFNLLSQETGSVIKVDDLRKIQEKLKLTPYLAQYKVAIIHPVENMNLNAANSLLKTLEEPSRNTLIILVSNTLRQLLPTIRSRCQLSFMPTPDLSQAIKWLQSQTIKTDAKQLLNIACGAPLLALKYEATGEVDLYTQFVNDFQSVQQKKIDPLRLSLKWDKQDFSQVIKWFMLLTSQAVKTRMMSAKANDIKISDSAMSMRQYFSFYNELLSAQGMMNTSVNKRLLLDNLFLKCQRL